MVEIEFMIKQVTSGIDWTNKELLQRQSVPTSD